MSKLRHENVEKYTFTSYFMVPYHKLYHYSMVIPQQLLVNQCIDHKGKRGKGVNITIGATNAHLDDSLENNGLVRTIDMVD
jgi:hypothetical protein